MKVIAVNGSPRKKWNTATLLEKAIDGAQSVGADAELIHLYDLNFKGCISCFACKRKGNKLAGCCAMKDELTPVLEKIAEGDVLLLGSPIYYGNVTGEMRSFLERLLFASMTYNAGYETVRQNKLASGFIYTMNVPSDLDRMNIPEDMKRYLNYEAVYCSFQRYLERLNGPSEYLLAQDTYQFDDYSKYEASMFDAQHKAQVRAEQFPRDCRSAFDMGVRLATG